MDTDQLVEAPTLCLSVVVAQAARGEELRRRLLGLSRGRRLELCLPAPAFAGSGLEYISSDVDRGIARAVDRLECSLAEMRREQVVAARGEVGEADPMPAIDSALVSFPAGEIVLVPSAERDQFAEKEPFAASAIARAAGLGDRVERGGERDPRRAGRPLDGIGSP
jgi:hypothetical protein